MNTTATIPLMPLGPVMLDVAGTQLSSEDEQRLLHPLVGAVILFSRNYENKQQLKELISSIKSLRNPSLLVAVDQEGGRVQRFREGFSELPPLSYFGQCWAQDKQTAPMLAFESAQRMASELIECGVDFSFAPVFDVCSKDSEVIGDRSVHSDVNIASELLGAYIDGMHCAGMVAIAKHFPGHGGVENDSHHCLPVDERAYDEIEQHDLIPYRALIDEIQGVMTAHVLFSNCDADIPTYSPFWLQKTLRKQLGFQGIVFSDDLSMQGAKAEQTAYSIGESASKALKAGCDMVLVCNDSEATDSLLSELNFKPNTQLSNRLSCLRARSES